MFYYYYSFFSRILSLILDAEKRKERRWKLSAELSKGSNVEVNDEQSRIVCWCIYASLSDKPDDVLKDNYPFLCLYIHIPIII
jgi:hypothetical protein